MDYNFSKVNEMVIKSAKDFCEREFPAIDAEMLRLGDYPQDLMQKFYKSRFLGMTVPKEYGGLGSTNLNFILICEQLGYTGSVCFLPLALNTSVTETVNHAGTEEQKKRFIPPLCNGTFWASTAFTEPQTGSDPTMLSTTAEPQSDGGYILNGTKRFISMANKPGFGVFYCKDKSLDHPRKNCTAFILDKTTKGITFSDHYAFMGLEGADTCDVFLNDVYVPKENILGTPGDGFKLLTRWIAGERIQQAGATVGAGQACLDESVKYAKQRMVQGQPLAAREGFYWMFAEMKTRIDACRALTYKTVCLQDEGKRFEMDSAGLKVFVIPTIQEVARMALQIHGSYGYTKEYKVERLYRMIMSGGVIASSTEINKTIVGLSIVMS